MLEVGEESHWGIVIGQWKNKPQMRSVPLAKKRLETLLDTSRFAIVILEEAVAF